MTGATSFLCPSPKEVSLFPSAMPEVKGNEVRGRLDTGHRKLTQAPASWPLYEPFFNSQAFHPGLSSPLVGNAVQGRTHFGENSSSDGKEEALAPSPLPHKH